MKKSGMGYSFISCTHVVPSSSHDVACSTKIQSLRLIYTCGRKSYSSI